MMGLAEWRWFQLAFRRYFFVYFQYEHLVIVGKLNRLVFRHSETQPTLMRDPGTELFCNIGVLSVETQSTTSTSSAKLTQFVASETNFSSFSALMMVVDGLFIRFELPCKIRFRYQHCWSPSYLPFTGTWKSTRESWWFMVCLDRHPKCRVVPWCNSYDHRVNNQFRL